MILKISGIVGENEAEKERKPGQILLISVLLLWEIVAESQKFWVENM